MVMWMRLLSLAFGLTSAQLMRRESHGAGGSRGSRRLQGALREALKQVPAEQLLFVEESLRDSYEAFPKDAKGNLPPHQALPALARAYFAKEHGWLVRGLETPGAPIIAPGASYREATEAHGAGDLYEVHALQDKAPELQAALKEAALSPVSSSKGMSLADISQTVAALEQILLEESVPLARAAYVLNELESEMEHVPHPLNEEEVHQVLLSYLLLFRHGLPRDLEDAKKHLQMKARARQASDWNDMKNFEEPLVNRSGTTFPWQTVKEAVMSLAKRYGRWQNKECEEMKSALIRIGDGSGRVRLADFHGSPKHPHYQFTEKEEYLQQAGILQEENGEKYVLISNYLLGASNCIASSEYFAVCCLNECERVLNHFEAAIQMPGAALEQVQQVARELNASALSQLSAAADASGVVVWNSPEFRRWLHSAFPLQCPRPTALEDEAVEAELKEAKDDWLPARGTSHGEGMVDWAKQHGVTLSPKVDFFSPSTPPSQGFCARAKERVEAGELLLQLPLAGCIRPLVTAPEKESDFVMDEQQKLMLQLLNEAWVKAGSSSWLPYLRTLPRAFPTLPLWYTPEEKRFLRGTSVDTLLEGSHIASDKDLTGMQHWCQQHSEVFPKMPSLEQLRWAASVVASRAFDSTNCSVILAPFADALNHSGVPHTRMRDCGDHLVFHAEREILPEEEVMNCYGLQGNTQWLMNGGFLDQSRPCDDLLVTPADVVSAVLDYLHGKEGDGEEAEAQKDSEEDQDASLCFRLSLLQDHGIGGNPFSLSLAELLPDDLATMILVICMSDGDYLSYQQQRAAGRGASIDLGGAEGEELSEPLLADLYGSLLRLVDLLRQRYETSLEEDLMMLQELQAEPQEPDVKRRRESLEKEPKATIPDGIRPENARNILLLRIGQKRVLKALEEEAADCFAD